jgi:predicted phage-related endonuclease
VAFENMAADFEQRTRLKVNLEDDDALLRDPGVNRVLQDRAVALVQGMSGAPMQPPANEAERAADEYLALQVAKATAQENKAREAFEKQAADFEQRFGIRVI